MHHIVYMSRVTTPPSPAELVALLIQARHNNEQAGVTGMLVYSDLQFMQVLEGEQQAVTQIYERIVQDPRHGSVFKLADKAIAERLFITWSMAFRELTPGEFVQVTGYLSPAQWEQTTFVTELVDTLLLNRMRELLLSK